MVPQVQHTSCRVCRTGSPTHSTPPALIKQPPHAPQPAIGLPLPPCSFCPPAGKYTIVGQVIDGMEVLDRMEKAPTGPGDRPLQEIKLTGCTIHANPLAR